MWIALVRRAIIPIAGVALIVAPSASVSAQYFGQNKVQWRQEHQPAVVA
jgi:hypothetical protein